MISNGFRYLGLVEDDSKKFVAEIFGGKNYVILKEFISAEVIQSLRSFWLKDGLDFYFADKIANKKVSQKSPPYMYYGKSLADKSFCVGVWNAPIDELSHEIMYQVAFARNLVSGQPLYSSVGYNCEWLQQYRVCRTVSGGEAVKKHADFMEEYRADPTGRHDFSPSRLQATLFLSEVGEGYESGGFYLDLDGQEVFADQLGVRAGDLLIWRYNVKHGVKDVTVKDKNELGFLRIIYPSFQFGAQ